MKINIIDVGCAGYMPEPWDKDNYGSSVGELLSVDLLDDELDYLETEFPGYILSKNIIFDKEEERPFYVCRRSRVSSLFKPNIKKLIPYLEHLNRIRKPKVYHISKYDIERIEQVKCVRFDTILDGLDINFDFLKVDTEGADFQVIKSLGEYLDTQIIAIHTELYFEELYEGIALFPEVNKFLYQHNFHLERRLNGVHPYWANFLYIRDDDSKREQIELIKDAYRGLS